MEILKENFLKLREKMMEKFKEDFARHRELGEKEVPIKTIGPINGVYYERGERSYFIRPRIRAGEGYQSRQCSPINRRFV